MKQMTFFISCLIILISSSKSQTTDIQYSLSIDKNIYSTQDTVHWYAKMINTSIDTIETYGLVTPFGIAFFEWLVVDSIGNIWNAYVVPDTSTMPLIVLPSDSLTLQWDTPGNNGIFSFPQNLYFGLMKPWFNYDYLEYDTVVFEIVEELTVNEHQSKLPIKFQLFQPYPSPFNPITTIEFSIPFNSFVTVKIYDIIGREVEMLVDQRLNSGIHSAVWNGSNFPSGIYFIKIVNDRVTQTQKVLLLK